MVNPNQHANRSMSLPASTANLMYGHMISIKKREFILDSKSVSRVLSDFQLQRICQILPQRAGDFTAPYENKNQVKRTQEPFNRSWEQLMSVPNDPIESSFARLSKAVPVVLAEKSPQVVIESSDRLPHIIFSMKSRQGSFKHRLLPSSTAQLHTN